MDWLTRPVADPSVLTSVLQDIQLAELIIRVELNKPVNSAIDDEETCLSEQLHFSSTKYSDAAAI